ncbi:MAG: hypothetical protein ACYC26_07975 [Phycisphaerales bacterium]
MTKSTFDPTGRRLIVATMILSASLAAWQPAGALETDQFTVPPQPLADIGPQVAEKLRDTLAAIIRQLNAELDQLTSQLASAANPATRSRIQQQIDQRLSGRLIADRLYDAVGVGVPETQLELWIRRNNFHQSQPAVFEVACADSVTGICIQRPLIMIGLAPTIHMFGCYFGTDKIGHFFQQGYENYELDLKGRTQGLSEPDRRKQIVAKGAALEKGVFGLFLSGIYSNADLAADYAGYKFYLNLCEPVKIGSTIHPPLFVRVNQRWTFNPHAAEPLTQPFVSDHFNEALTPCEYEPSFQPAVREAVTQRAPATLAFYHTTAQRELGRLEQLATWHGENYGHSGFDHLITLPGVMGLAMKVGTLAVTERPVSSAQTPPPAQP